MATVYEHDNKEIFNDTDDAYEIEDIRAHYAQFDARLVTATYTVIPPEKEGEPRKVVFAKKTGEKGSDPEPAWISVEERLPEVEVEVLAFSPGLPVTLGIREEDGEWIMYNGDWEPCEVTHWLPLPKSPDELNIQAMARTFIDHIEAE